MVTMERTPSADEAIVWLGDTQHAYWEAEEAWTKAVHDRQDAVLAAYNAGIDYRDIAEHLGVTKTVVFRCMAAARERHNLPWPLTPEEKASWHV